MKNINKNLLNMMEDELCDEVYTKQDLREDLKNGDNWDMVNEFFYTLQLNFEKYSKNLK